MSVKILKRASILAWLLAVPFALAVSMKGNMEAQSNPPGPKVEKLPTTILVDDFSSQGSNKKLGVRWAFFSDRLMGGNSAGKMEFVKYEDRSCLHLSGSVSPANNGGFLQAGVSLGPGAGGFDARRFDGVKLSVKGNGRPYALRLQTRDTRRAGQFYQASFATNGTWEQIEIPFARFRPDFPARPLNLRTLKSLAVAAAGKAFDADIFVDEISFYRNAKMFKKLTPEEERVIVHKGTEPPFTGKYVNYFEKGVYTCKRCGAKLFESSSKFPTTCGWPSFDDQIKGAVTMVPDADGVRTEIICSNCGAHLGHVFTGERLTPKNTRYCVNSISMNFIPAGQPVPAAKPEPTAPKTERAIFASGCFWGTEYYFQKAPGVISTTVGYTGGHVDHPTYRQVCTGTTGHAESVEVIYDPSKTSYEQLARLFFETHDFTQLNRQGPDIGRQYRSAIFYLNEKQKEIATKLVEILKEKGFHVKTEITPAGKFWPAETYHQDYYKKNGKTPYCHVYRKIF
jgi:peptide methionine sulfoxide reductase msrA/msrB